ncbi:hypothetical protein PFICI_06045 [Pestalotiopsis fici W106-1]|uniref:BTB domain-containing protein n=1 Tax=Pestalotiopsis fici (strain W106-1 / CGMCC3.15140) TaxID=1229662 RepID=W3X4H8_PESFW|nr:uncharacterized protein PFICI_06045 [Pestalotiopsis fici W106-1]ETS81043.1 hypothetical protein PFICI_06045 [Pestalotiopsis fici W106-1]
MVGPNEKEFMIHSSLLASLSKPLDSLINGPLKAHNGVTHLPETDEATFDRFCQFAYRGDYEVAELNFTIPVTCRDPEHKVCNSCKKNTKRSNKGSRQSYGSDGYCNVCDCHRVICVCRKGALLNHGTDEPKVQALWDAFIQESGISVPMLQSLEIGELAGRCWSDVLLAHARVYVLADYNMIDALAELAKKKLHQALILFELKEDNVDDITSLVDYVCENTVDKAEGPDRLRALLYRYCAFNIQQLSPNEKFRALLDQRGDLGSAIIQQLLERIS